MLGFGSIFLPLIIILLFLVLFSRTSSLNRRVELLSRELDNIKQGKNDIVSPVFNSTANNQLNNIVNIMNAPEQKRVVLSVENNIKNTNEYDLLAWFKENTILKIGVLLVLLGFGWFVSYAFLNNWIGPVGRITLGFISGLLVTLFGTYRLSKSDVQGGLFIVLGTALVTITSLAAQYYYNFFPPIVVLFIILLASLYTSMIAVLRSNEKLAVYGILLSLIAPYLSHTTNIDSVLLFSYLIVITISTIWISSIRNWQSSISVGVTGLLLYSIPYFYSFSRIPASRYFVLTLIFVNCLLYLVVSIWNLMALREKLTSEDLYLNVVNTIIIVGVTIGLIPSIYQSITLAVWIIVYAVFGYIVYKKTGNEQLMYIHALSSVVLLGIATSIELSGRTLIIALAFESLIITMASYLVTNKPKTTIQLSLITTLPAFMSMQSFTYYNWSRGVFNSDLFVLIVMFIVFIILGYFLTLIRGRGEEDSSLLPRTYLIIASIYLFRVIWLLNHYIFKNDTAIFVSLFIYTLVGLYFYFNGVFKSSRAMKVYGTAVLVCIIVRLIIIDIWGMDLVLRVVTFIVIGLMFISTAFISKNSKLEISK